jgi:pimeloyl-ACP methyl ester carboxylesterase
VVTQTDLELRDGRTLHVYDTSADGADASLTVFWHHGTPNLGPPPEPLFPAAARRGIRWVSYDRPGYGGSTPYPGRDVASAAADVTSVADALGIGRFAAMGHSGGSVFALACGALLPERVLGLVCVAALAPFHAEGLAWFAGMAVAGQALEDGLGGMVDDDLAYVAPWGFDPGRVRAPVLLLHGGQDRVAPSSHARWLATRIPSAELWLRPDAGHISVLDSAEAALDWLLEHT